MLLLDANEEVYLETKKENEVQCIFMFHHQTTGQNLEP